MSKKISNKFVVLCLHYFPRHKSYQKMRQGVKTTVQGIDVKWHFILHPLSGFIRHRREVCMTRRAL